MANSKNKNLIIVVLLIACAALAGGLIWTQFTPKKIAKEILSPDQATKIALDYLNKNILTGNLKASLVGEIEEEENFYKFQIKIGSDQILSYVTKDGQVLFPQAIDLTQPPVAEEKAQEKETTLGNFIVSNDELCQENNKPIIYFFGSEGCPHCTWEHPIIEEVASKFADYISFHNNMDSDKDMDIFARYSTGGIPTLVFGCKYYRVGSGERMGAEEEAKILTTLICDLTKGLPTPICKK